jgi:hypothetical protein
MPPSISVVPGGHWAFENHRPIPVLPFLRVFIKKLSNFFVVRIFQALLRAINTDSRFPRWPGMQSLPMALRAHGTSADEIGVVMLIVVNGCNHPRPRASHQGHAIFFTGDAPLPGEFGHLLRCYVEFVGGAAALSPLGLCLVR